MRVSKTDRAEAVAALRKILRKGDTVYGIVRSVSRSGMSRRIDLYTFRGGERYYLTGYACTVLGWPRETRTQRGMRVDGCGMDMVFHSVYSLAASIWPRKEGKDPGYFLRSEIL